MYTEVYKLIMDAFFQGAEVTGWIEMCVTMLSTFVVVLAFAVPFILVFKVIKLIMGR
mgnify:FL=1